MSGSRGGTIPTVNAVRTSMRKIGRTGRSTARRVRPSVASGDPGDPTAINRARRAKGRRRSGAPGVVHRPAETLGREGQASQKERGRPAILEGRPEHGYSVRNTMGVSMGP